MSGKSFILVLVCVEQILSTSVSQKLEWPGTFKIGESCERDIQCIRHAFCKIQKTCLCDTYYAPSLDKATCHVTIGASCKDAQGCETMSNAECRQNVCTCKDNFMIDINNSSNCITSPTAPGDICHYTDECKESMDMAYCIDNKCVCYTNHHFINETGKCLRMRGLYEPCTHNYECFDNEKYPTRLMCKDGECACNKGEFGCDKGSLMCQPSFILLLVFTFGSIFQTLT